MEVTVVLMRHKGEMLSNEKLEQAAKHHGFMENGTVTLAITAIAKLEGQGLEIEVLGVIRRALSARDGGR